jgi:hypothetical protein
MLYVMKRSGTAVTQQHRSRRGAPLPSPHPCPSRTTGSPPPRPASAPVRLNPESAQTQLANGRKSGQPKTGNCHGRRTDACSPGASAATAQRLHCTTACKRRGAKAAIQQRRPKDSAALPRCSLPTIEHRTCQEFSYTQGGDRYPLLLSVHLPCTENAVRKRRMLGAPVNRKS